MKRKFSEGEGLDPNFSGRGSYLEKVLESGGGGGGGGGGGWGVADTPLYSKRYLAYFFTGDTSEVNDAQSVCDEYSHCFFIIATFSICKLLSK